MPGAHKISKEYHDAFRNEERIPQWTNECRGSSHLTVDACLWQIPDYFMPLFPPILPGYGYKDTGIAWLNERGYEFKKVCCDAGDLIIWDSRIPHYNVKPAGDITRLAVYTCYAPVSTATQEDLIKKKNAFDAGIGTSHWVSTIGIGSREGGQSSMATRADGARELQADLSARSPLSVTNTAPVPPERRLQAHSTGRVPLPCASGWSIEATGAGRARLQADRYPLHQGERVDIMTRLWWTERGLW